MVWKAIVHIVIIVNYIAKKYIYILIVENSIK